MKLLTFLFLFLLTCKSTLQNEIISEVEVIDINHRISIQENKYYSYLNNGKIEVVDSVFSSEEIIIIKKLVVSSGINKIDGDYYPYCILRSIPVYEYQINVKSDNKKSAIHLQEPANYLWNYWKVKKYNEVIDKIENICNNKPKIKALRKETIVLE